MKRKPELIISKADIEDRAQIAQFEDLAPEKAIELIGDFLVARLGNQVIGYAEYYEDVRDFLLLGIYIAEEYRGKGIARRLFNSCASYAKDLGYVFVTSALYSDSDQNCAIMKGLGFPDEPIMMENTGEVRYYWDLLIGNPDDYFDENDSENEIEKEESEEDDSDDESELEEFDEVVFIDEIEVKE